jgi:hypothetical protein|nr:prenyltransferase/squalene oxidase repeat-containing protein [uncultured Acetatifactor sp.]
MKLDKEGIEHSVNIAKQCVISKKQYIQIKSNRYLVWPLFFMEGEQPKEDAVDVCTSALGIMSSSFFIDENSDEMTSTVREGVSTLLFVRNEDGSWPSKISLVSKDNISMEGVISDTYFALFALLSINFISNTPLINNIVDPKNNKVLSNLDDRLKIIEKSVQWLLDNRVSQGWGYTGTNYLEDRTVQNILPAYTLPSANAVIVISEILEQVKIVNPNFSLSDKMEQAVNETINWICEIQNSDGGFGIKRGEKSRIGNTARIIMALCDIVVHENLQAKVASTLNKAVKWILREYNPKKINFEDVSEDFSQFILDNNNGNISAYKRSILHETFLEPLIIDSLGKYYNKYFINATTATVKKSIFLKNRIALMIRSATENLMARQKKEGVIQGAVKSRRAASNEWYTMYTCSDLICSFRGLLNEDKLLKHVIKASLKQKILIIVYLVFAFAIVIPVIISEQPFYLAFLALVANPVAMNIFSSITEKLIIGDG